MIVGGEKCAGLCCVEWGCGVSVEEKSIRRRRRRRGGRGTGAGWGFHLGFFCFLVFGFWF